MAEGAEVRRCRPASGSLVFAFFCAARRMRLVVGPLWAIASFERGDGLLPADEQRDHHVREDDDVPQRQERNGAVPASGLLLVVSSEEHVLATCLLADQRRPCKLPHGAKSTAG